MGKKETKDTGWLDDDEEINLEFKDANGIQLENGDTIIAIKDLKVRGIKDIKRGNKFKNIRLTEESGIVESGKMVLKTEFFKKL